MLIRRSKQVLGHYGSERRHIEEAARLVTLGRLQLPDSVSAEFPLDRYAEALDVLTSKRGNRIRVVLQP
ncbi:hypothetical protein ACI8AF_02415 [Blastococcus sp. SYSU D00669]